MCVEVCLSVYVEQALVCVGAWGKVLQASRNSVRHRLPCTGSSLRW